MVFFGVSVSMTSPRSIITNGRGTLSISESSTEMVRQSEGKAAGTAAWIDTSQTPHTFFHTVLYAHNMTCKYDENRIDAEKLRFLLKSVKSYIIGKEYYVDTACTPYVHASLGTSVCYAEVRSAMPENLEVKGGEINSKKKRKHSN